MAPNLYVFDLYWKTPQLPDIVSGLQSWGVQHPAIEQHATLALELSIPVEMKPLPAGLLDLDADTLHTLALNRAGDRAARDSWYARERDSIKAQMDAELQRALLADAEQVTAQLRIPFDRVADTFRAAAAAGITETASTETLFTAPEDVRQLFLQLPEAARILSAIWGLRQALSVVCGWAPKPPHRIDAGAHGGGAAGWSGVDWSRLVLSHGGLTPPQPRAASWSPWLNNAEHLHLASTDVSDFDVLLDTDPMLADRLTAAAAARLKSTDAEPDAETSTDTTAPQVAASPGPMSL